MAEGLLRHYGRGKYPVSSAGTDPTQVHPMTVEVMEEIGIDLSGHRSKHVDDLLKESFDVIITTCDDARDQCPVYPGEGERLHWGLDDPAGAKGSREDRLDAFRRVRDRLIELIRARFLTDSR